MTIGSPNGGPPSSSSRTGSSWAVRVSESGPGAAYTRSEGLASTSPTVTTPESTSTPCSNDAVDGHGHRAAGLDHDLGPQQRRVRRDGRRVPQRRAEEDPRPPAGTLHAAAARSARRSGRRAATASGSATQSCTPWSSRVAGVETSEWLMPRPGRHQVELAGPHRGVVAGAVAVLDLAAEEPADGLQPGVRVRRDLHPAGVGHQVGPVVVDEAPRADQAALPLRQGAADGHRPQPAERHLARREHLQRRPTAARPEPQLGRIALRVGHDPRLARGSDIRCLSSGASRPVRSWRRPPGRRPDRRRPGRDRPRSRRTPGPRRRARPRRARAA